MIPNEPKSVTTEANTPVVLRAVSDRYRAMAATIRIRKSKSPMPVPRNCAAKPEIRLTRDAIAAK